MPSCTLSAFTPSILPVVLQNTTSIGFIAISLAPNNEHGPSEHEEKEEVKDTHHCQVSQYSYRLPSQDTRHGYLSDAGTLTCSKKWNVDCKNILIQTIPSTMAKTISSPSPRPTTTIPSSVPEKSETGGHSSNNINSNSNNNNQNQSFFSRTVEIAGTRIPLIGLIAAGVGLLAIVILLIACLLMARRKRRQQQQQQQRQLLHQEPKRQSKGKKKDQLLHDPEKGYRDDEDDYDDDNDDVESASHEYHTQSAVKAVYPSQIMSQSGSPIGAFKPRLFHMQPRSGSRSPTQSNNNSQHLQSDAQQQQQQTLPIASRHLSLDSSSSNSASSMNYHTKHRPQSLPTPSSSSSSSSSSTSRLTTISSPELPPIRRDALLSSISLSPIPYTPKSTFTPRTVSHARTRQTSDPSLLSYLNGSDCDGSTAQASRSQTQYIDLIPVEETPRLANTPLPTSTLSSFSSSSSSSASSPLARIMLPRVYERCPEVITTTAEARSICAVDVEEEAVVDGVNGETNNIWKDFTVKNHNSSGSSSRQLGEGNSQATLVEAELELNEEEKMLLMKRLLAISVTGSDTPEGPVATKETKSEESLNEEQKEKAGQQCCRQEELARMFSSKVEQPNDKKEAELIMMEEAPVVVEQGRGQGLSKEQIAVVVAATQTLYSNNNSVLDDDDTDTAAHRKGNKNKKLSSASKTTQIKKRRREAKRREMERGGLLAKIFREVSIRPRRRSAFREGC